MQELAAEPEFADFIKANEDVDFLTLPSLEEQISKRKTNT